jgi:malonyl CoA-acyl carrier protein transacylase
MTSSPKKFTLLGKACAEISSLVSVLDNCNADVIVTGTVESQLEAQMARLSALLEAVRAPTQVAPA